MNIDMNQLIGLTRVMLPFVFGWMAGRGWFDASQVGPLTDLIVQSIPVVVAAGMAIWAIVDWAKHNLIRRVAAMPQVKEVVTDVKTATTGPLRDVPNVVPVETAVK